MVYSYHHNDICKYLNPQTFHNDFVMLYSPLVDGRLFGVLYRNKLSTKVRFQFCRKSSNTQLYPRTLSVM